MVGFDCQDKLLLAQLSLIVLTDMLYQPTISVSPSFDRVYEFSNFTIRCSIKPQYPGGSFQLTLSNAYTTQNYTQRAIKHVAHFLFPSANRGHQGNYSCVYQIDVFSQNLSSASHPLSLNVSGNVKKHAKLDHGHAPLVVFTFKILKNDL